MAEWDEHERAYPGIRLVTSWREETGALGALAAITQLAPGEIAIESGLRVRGQARPGRVRIREESPERLLLEAEAPDPTWHYILVSLRDIAPMLRSYRIVGGKIAEEPVVLE